MLSRDGIHPSTKVGGILPVFFGKPCQGAGTEFHREVGDALWDTVSLEIRHLRADTFPLPSLACHEYYLSQNPAHLEIQGGKRERQRCRTSWNFLHRGII